MNKYEGIELDAILDSYERVGGDLPTLEELLEVKN